MNNLCERSKNGEEILHGGKNEENIWVMCEENAGGFFIATVCFNYIYGVSSIKITK